MSANITQNLGGFRAPGTSALPPPSTGAGADSFQSNNPYRQPSPAPGPPNEQYPSHDPPPYELATSAPHSPAPPVTDSKHEQEPRDLIAYGGQHLAGPSSNLALPQSSQRAQPAASASGSHDIVDKAMEKINPRDPLDPPPACFSRVVPAPSPETTYQALPQPLVIHAKPGKKFLEDAFVTTGTPPLHKHDIWAEDWVRFLEDIHIVARLTTGQKITAGILPMTMHVGFGGFFISRAIERGMRGKNVENVMQLLQIWNERFFKPRHLDVVLCRGDYRVVNDSNGKVRPPAPDRPNARPRPVTHSDSSSSSSSSSESEHESMGMGSGRGRGRGMRGRGAGRGSERRAERRERRDERREQRQERREERRERKARRREEKRSNKPYRLVVVSV